MSLDHLLATPGAADYLGVSPSFLNKLRCTGNGPCYVKLGRRVLYPIAELHSWLEASRRRSTSDQETAVSAPDDAKRLTEPALGIVEEAEAVVRQRPEARPPSGAWAPKKRPADRSRTVVAVLNNRFRVVDDGLQWMLQKRKGRPTPKSTGWRNWGCCVRSRALLLDGISELHVDPDALRVLRALPDDPPSVTRASVASERRRMRRASRAGAARGAEVIKTDS